MSAQVGGRRTDCTADLRDQILAVEEADVLGPGDGHQDAQPVLRCPIEQPARRHGERPQRVGAQLCHEPEVGLENALAREGKAVIRGSERAVRHAADVELMIADEEELAADGDGHAIERRSGSPLGQRAQHRLSHKWGRDAGR